MGHRHHRTPHPGREGVLLRRAGRLVTTGGRLVHRHPPERGPGHRCPGHGHRFPQYRRILPGTVIHGDHGTQFTSWAFTERARSAGLLPSLGSVGDPYDNAVAEAFWGRMQTELLNRKTWTTRVELANAIFEWIETSHHPNCQAARSRPVNAWSVW